MKRLDRLILKSFVGPLLLTFAIAVFVLLMQFVWKYIDDMVGKGLPFGIIVELLFYASVTFVPMALPIAVLFASIMTMGNFGEKYELVAMKAGGVSLTRVMAPMFFVVLLLTGVAFYFSNNVLPVAMTKYKTILFDVTRKKPALNIKPSEYYDDLDGYVIRVDRKDPSNGTLHDIVIYDHTKRMQQNNVVVADSGKMQMSPDERYLIFTLHDGNMYTEQIDGENYDTRPLTSISFKEQTLTFDLSSFAFDKTNGDFFSGNYQMMNVSQLKESLVRLKESQEKRLEDCLVETHDRMKAWMSLRPKPALDQGSKMDTVRSIKDDSFAVAKNNFHKVRPIIQNSEAMGQLPFEQSFAIKKKEKKDYRKWEGLEVLEMERQLSVISKARNIAIQSLNQAQSYEQMLNGDEEFINRHYIEWHRKYTLSIACLVMFLVGAPFGSIVRKGGLGMPLVASVLFFVIYYVIGMICEKSVRESAMGPIGMWVSTLVLLPIGLLLTLHATTDGNYTNLFRFLYRKKGLVNIDKKNTNQNE